VTTAALRHPLDRFPHTAAMEPAEERFRAELRAFLSEHPAPPFDRRDLANSLRAGLGWHADLAKHGFPVPACPHEFGGADRTVAMHLVQAEEMAAAGANFSVNIVGISMLTPLLLALGTAEQRRRWIPPVVQGRELWCQLFSEPDAGSDLFALRCTATVAGDALRLNGQKIWSSSAAEADYGLMLARTEPGSKGRHGISCVIVDMSAPGITARAIRQMNGGREFAEVFFDDAPVPLTNVVGELHCGATAALKVLASERGGLTMGYYALLAAQFEHLLSAATPAAVARHRDIVTDIWAALAAQRLGAIRQASGAGDGSPDLGVAAAGKMGIGTLAVRIAHLRADLLGARLVAHVPGDDVAADMAERFTGALALSFGGGTHQMQRNTIADGLLRLPR
jgi:alkylation response protein AidB-like acyl-CoA dehydrogenase